MSVIFKNKNGWLIDHKRFVDDIYANFKVSRRYLAEESDMTEIRQHTIVCSDMVCPKFDKRFFNIYSQFMMDSQMPKVIKNTLMTPYLSQDSQLLLQTERKRKRAKQKHNMPYEDQIADLAKQSLPIFVQIGHELAIFNSVPLEFIMTNNKEARLGAKNAYNYGEEFSKVFRNLSKTKLNMVSYDESFVIQDIINTVVHYCGSDPCLASICNSYFLIPPYCSFYMSDIQRLRELTELGKGRRYDFIVLDPPWFNKSVKRKKGYSTLNNDEIIKIPMDKLSNDGCIFVVWVTNNQAHIDFVQQELFPAWKVKYCATWHWLKVTVSGELICNLNSRHKKPYEHLIIGQKFEEGSENFGSQFEDHKIIISVPSSIHSHKPPLQDVFESYLKPSSKKLELFARYLLPGWTSWGNEVLLFQHLNFFKDR